MCTGFSLIKKILLGSASGFSMGILGSTIYSEKSRHQEAKAESRK
jgi:hypothetical protein